MTRQSSATKDRVIRNQVRSVPCPTCGAETGKFCIRQNGTRRYSSHVTRWQVYRNTLETKGQPK
jgi:hypothetical protein